MLRMILVATALSALAACSSWEPVIDLKASKEPRTAQEDWMECEWLAKKYASYGSQDPMTAKCLGGRGHSVLNSP